MSDEVRAIVMLFTVLGLSIITFNLWRQHRAGYGATVEVSVNGISMRQLAGTIQVACMSICGRWNASPEHAAVCRLEQCVRGVVPTMAPGIERFEFKLRIWEG